MRLALLPLPTAYSPWFRTTAIMILTVGLMGCQGGKPPAAAGPPPTPVTIATVQPGSIADVSEYVARVESQQVATLRPQTSGQVMSVDAISGSLVSAGAVIVRIDPLAQQAVVNSKEAGIAAYQGALTSAQALLKSYEAARESRVATLTYQQELYKRNLSLQAQGAISQNALEANQRDLRQAEADLAASEANITAQKAAIAQAQSDLQQSQADAREASVQLRYYTITAPVSGRLGDISVKVGDYVTPQTAVTSIRQETGLDVVIAVPLERAPLLRTGLPLELLDATGQPVGEATTYFIAPQTEVNSQSVTIKARYDNRDQQLRADQFVRVRLTWSTKSGVLIPLTAISRIAGQSFVFVAQSPPEKPEQLIAAQVPVQVGQIQGNAIQIVQGLQPGQQIVTSGVQKLFPNAPIMPDTALPQGTPPP